MWGWKQQWKRFPGGESTGLAMPLVGSQLHDSLVLLGTSKRRRLTTGIRGFQWLFLKIFGSHLTPGHQSVFLLMIQCHTEPCFLSGLCVTPIDVLFIKCLCLSRLSSSKSLYFIVCEWYLNRIIWVFEYYGLFGPHLLECASWLFIRPPTVVSVRLPSD